MSLIEFQIFLIVRLYGSTLIFYFGLLSFLKKIAFNEHVDLYTEMRKNSHCNLCLVRNDRAKKFVLEIIKN